MQFELVDVSGVVAQRQLVQDTLAHLKLAADLTHTIYQTTLITLVFTTKVMATV